MTFANPWPALIVAGIAVPLLLLLYILKLRRQRLRMASTLLWRQSFEDLQVNVPFQRLRTSLLFFLQLLLILVLILALSEPLLQIGESPAPRMILLIDRSASMNATIDEDRTRFDEAKDAARAIIERIGRSSEISQIMILTFGRTAQVVSGFESNRQFLLDAVDSITPTDEEADLEGALQLAGAFAGRGEDDTDVPPDVVLISDGGISRFDDRDGFLLRSGEFRYLQVGPSDPSEIDNVGIVSFSARRDYEDPARVLVFARLVNAAMREIKTLATLTVDGKSPTIKRVVLPPAGKDGPGEQTVTFTIDLQQGAALELSHGHQDDLSADDTARLVMTPPLRPRIALVYGEKGLDSFLSDLVVAMQPESVDHISLTQYEQNSDEQFEAKSGYDLIIFDRVSGHRLPSLPSLTMGGTPAGIDLVEPVSDESRQILSWDRQHPVLRFVSLDTVVFQDFNGFRLPATATTLAQSSTGTIMAVLKTRDARHVVVGFELPRSNWPVHVSITVFFQNVLDYLTLAGSLQGGLAFHPGESITVRPVPGEITIDLNGPLRISIPTADGSGTTLPLLRRAGLYTLRGAATPHDRIAVSVLSELESDLRPRATVTVNANDTGGANVANTVPLELWPWLVGLAFVLLVLEWLWYCHRLQAMS